MKGTEGGGGAGIAKKSFGVMCQPRMGLVGWGYKDGKVPTAQRASELKSASAEEGNRRRIKS